MSTAATQQLPTRRLFTEPIVELTVTCRSIIEEVAAKHRMRPADLIGERRARPFVVARQEAMWRCAAETAQSLPQIGRAFKRDHTTVGHGMWAHATRNGLPEPRGGKRWARVSDRGPR